MHVSLASLAQITIALLRREAESFRENGNILVRSTIHFLFRPVEFNRRTDDVPLTLQPVHILGLAPWLLRAPESLSTIDNEIWLQKIQVDFSPEGDGLAVNVFTKSALFGVIYRYSA